jgi:hypothetical protein
MAIIYSYPPNSNILPTDILICTSTVLVSGKPKNQTKSILIQNLTSYINTSSTNNLNQVLTNGNSSLLNAKIGELYLYDTTELEYGRIKLYDSGFNFYNSFGNATNIISKEGIVFFPNANNASLLTTTITANRTYQLPNASGTIALTSDLSTYVPYTGATQAVNLGAFNLTVNSISVGKGSGSGAANTAVGNLALSSATTGFTNTAFGSGTLKSVTTGYENVAIGHNALTNGISFTRITAIGWAAGENHTSSIGSGSVYIGWGAGRNTTSAYNCTFIGANAAVNNTTGNWNTGIGESCMQYATTGIVNTTLGVRALLNNTTGSNNVAIGGFAANLIGSGTTNTVSNQSIFIGANTRALNDNETNQIVIGDTAVGSGSNTVTLGNTSITTTRLRGIVQGGSFVKDGGTSLEHLMANGTVSTNGTLFSAVSTTYQVAAGALQSISSAIPSGIFTNGNLLKLNAAITTTAASVAIATIEFYINSAATTVGATLIGRYNGPIGNQYIPIDRFFWVSGTTIYGRDFTASASTSTSNSTFAINSVAIPATQFYIITQVTTTSTDRACISSFQIEKS